MLTSIASSRDELWQDRISVSPPVHEVQKPTKQRSGKLFGRAL